jgi:hypothetical protein
MPGVKEVLTVGYNEGKDKRRLVVKYCISANLSASLEGRVKGAVICTVM